MPVPAAKKNYIADKVLKEKVHPSVTTAGPKKTGSAPVGQSSNFDRPPKDGQFDPTPQKTASSFDGL